MASSRLRDIVAEECMYGHVNVRTASSGRKWESAVENDKNGKRMVIATYMTRDDAEFFHQMAVLWAVEEHRYRMVKQ